MNRPLMIVLTSTRNYGWCTRAFLEANTKWADYVIILDQMSTDGTREMCSEYENVILVDNPDLEYNESKRCRTLIERAREIPGDKILFDLAIDEVMPANFQNSECWNKIMSSKPGELFFFRWANLLPDDRHYKDDTNEKAWMYNLLHDDGITPYVVQKTIHAMTLPYPSNAIINEVYDVPILHFGGGYYPMWDHYKFIYYQMVEVVTHARKDILTLCRTYSKWANSQPPVIKEVPKKWIDYGFNIYSLVDNTSTPIIADYMRDLIKKEGTDKFAVLDIWSDELCEELGIEDPRKWYHKLIHEYISVTKKHSKNVLVRGMDKIIKIILRSVK